tara:strand:+ start:4147 stop:4503 length:357 start_codon:yes stop_codon:yes gene_type:complete
VKVVLINYWLSTNNSIYQMADGVAVALRPVLCEDIGRKIQHIVYENALKERNLHFVEIHRELYAKAFSIFTDKCRVIEYMMVESPDISPNTIEYSELQKDYYEWSRILDNIYDICKSN